MQWNLINDNKVLSLVSATELELDQLKLTFEKESPNARWDPRVKKGLWSGKINFFKSNRYLPSGLWYELVELSKKFNFELKIQGIENKFDFEIDKEDFSKWVEDKWLNSPIKPRDYQIESAFNIIKYKSSLSEIATSAGKTLIIFMVLAYLLEYNKSKKILMIVPSVDLVIQSTEDFYEYNKDSVELPLQIQQIFSGSTIREKSNIIIGTFQSLTKKNKEYFDDFDTVVVDECLHPNTLITMEDGSKKLIKDVKIGDKVLTTNDKTNKIQIKEVDFVYKNISNCDNLYKIETEDQLCIKITGNHKVKLINGYKRTDELICGDLIISDNTDSKISKIKRISIINYKGDVYNLRIKSTNDLNHNYFANDLNVANCHRATSYSIKNILSKATNADRIFGLTGTVPKPNTIDRFTLCSYTGPIITSIRADFLMEGGYITKCEVLAIEMNYAPNEIRSAFSNLFNKSSEDRKKLLALEQNYAINSQKRLDFITDFILKNNKNCLVLFHRIEHGNKLYNTLRQKSDRKVLYIDGGIDKDRRSYYKDVLEEDNIKKRIILEFGGVKYKFDENDKIKLSDNSIKIASDIGIEDDVCDIFLSENKEKIQK